eukprot:4421901-Lingulodinium_polyedra.AAC.1
MALCRVLSQSELLTELMQGGLCAEDSFLLPFDAYGPFIKVGAIVGPTAAVILPAVSERVQHPVGTGYP